VSRLRKTGVCRDLSSLATRRVEVLVLGVLEGRDPEPQNLLRCASAPCWPAMTPRCSSISRGSTGSARTRHGYGAHFRIRNRYLHRWALSGISVPTLTSQNHSPRITPTTCSCPALGTQMASVSRGELARRRRVSGMWCPTASANPRPQPAQGESGAPLWPSILSTPNRVPSPSSFVGSSLVSLTGPTSAEILT
jgi:hypothetical protein